MVDYPFVIRPEVHDALESHQPLVALETAVLTHGLPYPDNIETMTHMAQEVRKSGAIPAVIGLKQGEVVVGLESPEWEEILIEPEKCSLRDLAPAVMRGKNGGTTVALTAYVAHRAGIRAFATGGIGGVHRGAQETWDISADLYAMHTLPVIIVSSGAKSILDIPKTLEFLESLGVPVVGYRTPEVPGFYVSSTGHAVSTTVQDPKEVAEMHRVMQSAGMQQALLLVQPGPLPVDSNLVESLIAQALKAAAREHVSGKAMTPFMLGYLNQEAGDILKRSNIALLKANAALAGEVAITLYA